MHDFRRQAHHLLRAMGRPSGRDGGGHGGRHGGGHYPAGGGFMGGRHGFPGGRKLASTDLQLVILVLLAERPAHGYELIRTLQERSGGFYSPSPGMIYPALTYLEEIGHAQAEPDGTRKLYRITENGSVHLASHRATADAILQALTRIGGRMEEVREAFAGVSDPDPGPYEVLHQARHALKQALFAKRGCGSTEAGRIAAVLDRAAREILGEQG